MLNKLKERPDLFKFYNQFEIPKNMDCYLQPSNKIGIIVNNWLGYANNGNWEEPNGIVDYIPCSIESISSKYLNIKVLILNLQRWHTLKLILPVSNFISAFLPFTSHGNPYIIVEKNWFYKIKTYSYSMYCVIDFIGIRDLILKAGELNSKLIIKARSIVNNFSVKNSDFTFMTLADTIIIKSSWKTLDIESSNYNPEKFIVMINLLMKKLKKEVSLDSYAIFTQGANFTDENKLLNSKISTNHYFLPSISIPFIEAFEIDNDIRERIRSNTILKSSMYLEGTFYSSLKRTYLTSQEPVWVKKYEFESKKTKSIIEYIPISFDKLEELVELSKK